jgi:hypothetical protein
MAEHKGTYDTALVNQDLVVLRHIDLDKIDPETYALAGDANIEYKTQERSLLWFRDGYVLNDQPRVFDLVKELMAATLGFAVGRPDTGQILADNLTLRQAEAAIAGATTKLALNITIPKIEDDNDGVALTAEDAEARSAAAVSE